MALADTVGVALQVVLDRLTPAERVAFVLHDSFGFDFATIAAMLDTTPAAARKLASRARAKVAQPAPEDALADWEVVDAFLAAARGGDLDRLLDLLAPDVVVTGDAAAVAMGTPERIAGRQDVAAFFDGAAKAAAAGLRRGPARRGVGAPRRRAGGLRLHGRRRPGDPDRLPRRPGGAGRLPARGGGPSAGAHARRTHPVRSAAGRSAKAFFVSRYQPIDRTGCRQRPFMSSCAGSWAASPPRTASRRWRSCALMTSSAVSPRSSRSHGPPSWRQVMVFIVVSSEGRCCLLVPW